MASEARDRKGIPNPIGHADLGPIGHAALGGVLAGVTALVVILATLNGLDSLKQGLIATYFSDLNCHGRIAIWRDHVSRRRLPRFCATSIRRSRSSS